VNNPKLLEYSFRVRMAEGEPDGGGYVQIPADCVNMCAESLGIAVTQDVIPALAEDVNYRVREATQVRMLQTQLGAVHNYAHRMLFSS